MQFEALLTKVRIHSTVVVIGRKRVFNLYHGVHDFILFYFNIFVFFLQKEFTPYANSGDPGGVIWVVEYLTELFNSNFDAITSKDSVGGGNENSVSRLRGRWRDGRVVGLLGALDFQRTYQTNTNWNWLNS